MKLHAWQISNLALIMLFLCSPISTAIVAESQFEVELMTIKVYRDGLIHVRQTLIVDDLLPEIDLPLLSSSVENLIVLDENELMVDYQLNAENLTIFTLGASRVSIEYDTIALTKKEAEVWTLILNNTFNLSIFLPQNSTILYLNLMPTKIETMGNELSLSLYPGQWELSYVVPLLPKDQNGDVLWAGIPFEYLATAIIVVSAVIIIAALVILRKRKINIKKILSSHPELKKEDIAVIEFLAERKGKAFEAEIRERFPDVPRTSLWRLVRRLERLEIVDVKKIGLENQVQLRK